MMSFLIEIYDKFLTFINCIHEKDNNNEIYEDKNVLLEFPPFPKLYVDNTHNNSIYV